MVERNEEIMEISDRDMFLKNYKAVYNAMTAKPDCMSKAYPRNVIVTIDDITELNNRIMEKFRTQYDDAGFSVNAFISLKGRQKLDFPNWRSFSDHVWNETEIISGMYLIWEFNVVLPKFKVPEKHTLTLKISNGIKPEEVLTLMLSGKLEQVDEIEQNVCPIVAKMDFVDTTIGNEVLNIVSKWVKGLKSSNYKKGKLMMRLKKYRKTVSFLVNYVTVFISILLSVSVLNNKLGKFHLNSLGDMKLSQVSEFSYYLLGCFIFCFLLYKFSEVMANLMFKLLDNYGNEHVFDITKGDKRQQEYFRNREKNDRKKLVFNIFLTVSINIICGIITFYITKGE